MWVLPGEDLDVLTERVWEKIKSDGTCDTEAAVDTLPLVENLDALPYKDKSGPVFSFCHVIYPADPLTSLGVACFVVDGVRATACAPTADKISHFDCLLCGISVLSTKMHTHTGQHIIRRLYGMNESGLKRRVRDAQVQRCIRINNAFRSVKMHVGFVVEASVLQQ